MAIFALKRLGVAILVALTVSLITFSMNYLSGDPAITIAGEGARIEDIENIGPHYAQTLKAWRENFIAAEDRIRAMKFDDVFIRKWLYYFSYCEAAFAMRSLNDLHLVITRPHNRSLTPS